MNQVGVRFLILKFGKILLYKTTNEEIDPMIEKDKLALLGGYVYSQENLDLAVRRILIEKCGWETNNIRLFQVNSFTDANNIENQMHEVVFIVDAVKNNLSAIDKVKGLRWFPLNELPPVKDIDTNHAEIVYAFRDLVHPGKTLDLDRLPPVFSLKKPEDVDRLRVLIGSGQ